MHPLMLVFRPGEIEPFAKVTEAHGGKNWTQCAEELAELFGCLPDDIDAPDVYFGGSCDDDTRIDAIVINAQIVGTFDKPITLGQLAEIYANPANSHAKLEG